MKPLKALLLVLVSCSLLISCSSNDEKKALKAVKLPSFVPSVKIERNFRSSVGQGKDKRISRFVPAVHEGIVYASDVKGKVFAYDIESGKRLWKTKLKKSISASIAYSNKTLILGGFDGEVIALSAESGEPLWEAQTSSEILSVPTANDDTVVVQTLDGRLFGFTLESGELSWQYDHVMPSLTLRGTADPLIIRKQLISAFDNGQLVSLNAKDGSLKWSARVSQPKGRTELDKLNDIDGTPLVKGGFVYAATYNGAVAAFSKSEGELKWRQDVSSHRNLVATNSALIVVTEESHITAYDLLDGRILWANNQLHRRGLGSPALLGEYIAVVDDEGYMHVINPADGSFVARKKPAGSGFNFPMLTTGETLFILSDSGTLSAYRVAE